MATISERRKADRERVKRWREKHQKSGGQSLQVMLTPEARKVLDHERERTGESITAIVNRAVLQLGTKETAGSADTIGTRQPKRDNIVAKIIMMNHQGMNHSQIARALNDKGVQTFSGKGTWYPGTIRNLLNSLRKEGGLSEGIKANIKELLEWTAT
jgi:hypothetical protein